METEARWTLDELVQLVGDALAGDSYPGAPNGRVRDVPDRRAVRWYATIGLVDRPLAVAGRPARYGPRHLLQLVAVKRRQAQGRTLAEIQAELAGATDATLRRVAALPDGWPPAAPAESGDEPRPARTRFWAAAPPATPSAAALSPAPPAPSPAALSPAAPATPTPSPAAPTPSPAALSPAPPAPSPAAPASSPAAAPAAAVSAPALLTGIPLGAGAVLLVPARPDHDDVRAIEAAARPLLDLLAERGLIPPPPDVPPTSTPQPDRSST